MNSKRGDNDNVFAKFSQNIILIYFWSRVSGKMEKEREKNIIREHGNATRLGRRNVDLVSSLLGINFSRGIDLHIGSAERCLRFVRKVLRVRVDSGGRARRGGTRCAHVAGQGHSRTHM